MVTRPAPARCAAAAARRDAPVMPAPASRVRCPRLYLCESAPGAGRCQSPGALRQARGGTASSSTVSGRPISARTVSPQRVRPGSRRWPGLRRKKVTVTRAAGAKPRTWPVAPSTPEGTSTASTLPSAAANVAATAGSSGRARPAPKTASMTSPARAASAGSKRRTGPAQAAAAREASLPGRGGARGATATGQPSASSRRAAT